MDRQVMIEEIITTHNKMAENFKKLAKVPPTHLAFKDRNLADAKEDSLIHVLSWLRAIEKGEYTELMKAYNLVTPDVWQYYEQVELEDTQEQKILKKAQEKCLSAWRARPQLLNVRFTLNPKIKKIKK